MTMYRSATSAMFATQQITSSLDFAETPTTSSVTETNTFHPLIEMKTSPLPPFGNEIAELISQSTGDANGSGQMLSSIGRINLLSTNSIATTSKTVIANETSSAKVSPDVETTFLTDSITGFSVTTPPENGNRSRRLSTNMTTAAKRSTSIDDIITTLPGIEIASGSSSTTIDADTETVLPTDENNAILSPTLSSSENQPPGGDSLTTISGSGDLSIIFIGSGDYSSVIYTDAETTNNSPVTTSSFDNLSKSVFAGSENNLITNQSSYTPLGSGSPDNSAILEVDEFESSSYTNNGKYDDVVDALEGHRGQKLNVCKF